MIVNDGVSGAAASNVPLATNQSASLLGQKPVSSTHIFDYRDLYGPNGSPSSADIAQDAVGNCFALASMGAVADARPDIIAKNISYDPKSQSFSVTFYRPNPNSANGVIPIKVSVTQAEIQNNIGRQGGSLVDNSVTWGKVASSAPGVTPNVMSQAHRTGPIWPTVMETAYLKLFDNNPSNGLQQGYNKINQGGQPFDALFHITGQSTGYAVPLTRDMMTGQVKDAEYLGRQIQIALNERRPVVLSTQPESGPRQDGLVDAHGYIVTGITKVGSDYMVTLRNPWGTNTPNTENPKWSPTQTVSLANLITTGGLGGAHIVIGPR